MSKERYTLETLAAGQPRPYADSIYHYRLTVEWQGIVGFKDPNAEYVARPKMAKEIVRRIAFALCEGWVDNPGPFDRTLKKFEMIAPGVWEVLIVERFAD